jgi:hypothetical protein
MKIECSWCRAEFGEKCSGCGSARIVSAGEREWVCQECGLVFEEGQGGISSTICPECRAKIKGLPPRLTEEDLVERAARRAN